MKLSSEKITDNLIILPLVLVPLVFTYRATHYYVPKTALVQVLGFACFTAWLIRLGIKHPEARLQTSRLDIPVLLFLVWTGLSVIWAGNRYLALESLVFLTSLAAVYFLVSKTSPSLRAVSFAVSSAALSVSIYGILQSLGMDFLSPAPAQAVSTLGNVNFAGEFTAASLFFTTGIFFSGGRKVKILAGAAGSIQLAYLMLTGARGGWVGLFTGAAVFFALMPGKGIRTGRALIYVLSGLTASLALITAIGGAGQMDRIAERAYSIFNMQHPSVQVRLHVWKSALEIIKDNPAAGAGAGNLRIIYPLFRSLEEVRISGTVTQVARVHNDFLETAVDLGVIGLGFFLWLIAEGIKTVKQAGKEMGCLELGIAAGLSCILASSMFGFPMRTASTALLFWTGLGIISRRAGSTGDSRPVFPGSPSLISGGAAVLLLFTIFHTFTWYTADTHLKKAMEHESRREWPMMRDELEKSIKYYYPAIESHNRLAGAYIRLGDIENTYATLNSILELHPNHPWAHRALGQIYLELNQHEKGFKLLERAAGLNPVFISYLGKAHLSAGNIKEAEHELYRQIRLGFGDEHTYAYLGEVYEAAGENEKALRAYRRALEIEPGMRLPSESLRELDRQTENTGE